MLHLGTSESCWVVLSFWAVPNVCRFYYADERLIDSRPAREEWSGEAYAIICLRLAQDPQQQAWNHTFVKDHGYVDFSDVDRKNVDDNIFL